MPDCGGVSVVGHYVARVVSEVGGVSAVSMPGQLICARRAGTLFFSQALLTP